MKVQFGAGGNALPGFINHDFEVDINNRLPYDDNAVEFVFAEHVFEHIVPAYGLKFLDECHRILMPSGVLRLCVPTIDRIRDVTHARDMVFGHGHQAAYTADSLYHMLRLAGFDAIKFCLRSHIDSHWKVIGIEKDDIETTRVEATK